MFGERQAEKEDEDEDEDEKKKKKKKKDGVEKGLYQQQDETTWWVVERREITWSLFPDGGSNKTEASGFAEG